MKPLLLFIDDDPQDAELACLQLGKAGIQVDHATAQTALTLTAALEYGVTPALILSDIVLPQFDSWDALRICKRLAPTVPFVLYSGTVSMRDRKLAEAEGVYDAIEKDLPAHLVAVVRRVLDQPKFPLR